METGICLACYTTLPEFWFHTLESNNVTKKIWGHAEIQSGTSSYVYKKGNNIQRVIHEIKYAGSEQLCRKMVFHAIRKQIILNWLKTMDCIVPVPLHKIKLLIRGFNQSNFIAKAISHKTKLPIVENALKRKAFTFSQTQKNRDHRFQNMHSVFRRTSKHDLSNKHILLVDDVLTTGATMAACIRELNQFPGATISCYTLAVAER